MDPSKLAGRLREIVGHAPRIGAGVPHAGTAVPGDGGASAGSRIAEVALTLGGDWHQHAAGSCLVVERRFDTTASHGRASISELSARIEEALPSLRLLANGAAARTPLLFFDLETTGLSGGAGTYAFLIGCGWFDAGGTFVTRQHVLTRLAEERAVLRAFAGDMARAGALVSFNGKTFDGPLLETRYLYHRLEWPGADLPHLDMLPPARRFWRARPARAGADTRVGPAWDRHTGPSLRLGDDPSSCSLGALERRVLEATRVGDVPGFEIPARYFQFLRSGDARPLAAVLEHNRLDLLSLAGITARLLSIVHLGCRSVEQPVEALALGRLYSAAGLDDRADEAFRHAVDLARSDGESTWIAIEALRALARAARRRRRFDEAAERWREVLRVDGCPREVAYEAHEALAIHHEHRLRDLEAARSFARRILEEPPRPAWADAVRHRLARIERKMGLLDF